MRRLAPLVLALVCVSTAAAAAPRGTAKSDTIVGPATPDAIKARGGNDFVQSAFGGTDRVDCGAGKDVVTADLSDVVAANCEVVSRRLSLDPYTNSDSHHESAVEPDSASFGNTVVAVYQLGRRAAGAAANIGTAT